MLCLLQDGSRGHTLHQCQTWQWEPPMRQLWPCKQKLRVWAKTSPSFPIVRSSVPATPGAPPEVFVEARMELWAAIRGCFTLELRAQERQYWLILWLVILRFADFLCRCLFTQQYFSHRVSILDILFWNPNVKSRPFFFFPVNQFYVC